MVNSNCAAAAVVVHVFIVNLHRFSTRLVMFYAEICLKTCRSDENRQQPRLPRGFGLILSALYALTCSAMLADQI